MVRASRGRTPSHFAGCIAHLRSSDDGLKKFKSCDALVAHISKHVLALRERVIRSYGKDNSMSLGRVMTVSVRTPATCTPASASVLSPEGRSVSVAL